jgi:NAD-reducing hydrogenase large subunit
MRPGGVFFEPGEEVRAALKGKLEQAKPLLLETVRLVKMLLRRNEDIVENIANEPTPCMALVGGSGASPWGDKVALVGEGGGERREMSCSELLASLEEKTHSHNQVRYLEISGRGETKVGPLARLNVNGGYGTELADAEVEDVRGIWGFPLHKMMVSHFLRIVEMLHAWERMSALLHDWPREGGPASPLHPAAGEGYSVVEGPEGTFVYRLELDGEGRVRKAGIYTPLQFNIGLLERSLSGVAVAAAGGEDEGTGIEEMVVRAFAPCFNCGVC